MAIPVFLQRLTAKEEKGADTPSWDGCSAGEAIDRQRAMVAAIGRKTVSLFHEAVGIFFSGNEKEARALLRRPETFTRPLMGTAKEIAGLFKLDLTSAELLQAGQLQWVTACIRRVGASARDILSLAVEMDGEGFSEEGERQLREYAETAGQLLMKSLNLFESRSFDQLGSFQQQEEAAEEQEAALKDGYFLRLSDECHEPGVAFLSMMENCTRCCTLAGEIACSITGREKL